MLGSHQSNISSLIIMYHQSIYPIYYSLGHSQVLNYNSISVPVLKHCPALPSHSHLAASLLRVTSGSAVPASAVATITELSVLCRKVEDEVRLEVVR